MSIDLYHNHGSAPSRAVRMTAKALGIELNLIDVDIFQKEQLKPEYVKLNPQHMVPTLVDGDVVASESRALMCYLVSKYGGEDNKLYPKCLKKRLAIDRYLYFDCGTLYSSFVNYFVPQIFLNEEPNPARGQKITEAIKILEEFLGEKKFLLGEDYTIADLSIAASLSNLDVIGFDISDCPRAKAYYERLKQLPFWDEINTKGMEMVRSFFESKKAQK